MNKIGLLCFVCIAGISFLFVSIASSEIKKEYYLSGKTKSETTYKQGKKNGPSKEYNRFGTLVSEKQYKDGLKNGIAKYYYDNGSLREEISYRQGKRNGAHKYYNKNGKLEQLTNFANGKKNATSVYYYPNGKKKKTAVYKNGKINGKVSYYTLAGKVNIEETYANGVLKKRKTLQPNGTYSIQTDFPRENVTEKTEKIKSALKSIVAQSRTDIERRKKLLSDLKRGAGINTSVPSVRLRLPFVSKQHDGWSCGLHTATRLLQYKKYDASYEKLRRMRKLATLQLDSDKGPYTLPHALEGILRNWHSDSWWMNNANFNVVKNLLRQNKPVAALIDIPGKHFSVTVGGIKLKAPATHWVVISGFDDRKKTVYYYDPLKEGEQQDTYNSFMQVWSEKKTAQGGRKIDPLLMTYGFVTMRTIAFCN